MMQVRVSAQDELVELAAQEGHDADVPSNVGFLDPEKAEDILKYSNQTLEKDIEKRAGNAASARASFAGSSRTSTIGQFNNTTTTTQDNNLVNWDGKDDPQNPMNWSKFQKWGSIAVVSGVTFLIPLGSSILAPGIPQLIQQFHSTSELLPGFTVSVYVLGFAFGPLIIAPLSEMYGRLPVYHSCNVLFILFNICCGLSKSIGMLVAFRFLAGCVGASPLTLGGGTIADLIPREQRATAMSIWVMGPKACQDLALLISPFEALGPVLGPIAGGFISDDLGWRWIFWILSMAAGVVTVLGFFLMKETYAPKILEQKAKALRKSTGNPNLRSILDSGLTPKDLFWFSIMRPTKMLLFSPIVLLLSIYVAVTYAYLYMFFTTLTEVFENQYHFRHDLVGLGFSGIGIGQFFGQFLYSYLANRSMKKHMARGDSKPEDRLHLMIVGAILIPIGLFWYGWTVEAKTHWVVPMVGTGVFSLGLLFIFMPTSTYLVDVFLTYAASAMAANTVLRSALAAILPLAGPKMYAKLGYGWGTSLLGFIALLLVPIPFIFIRYGERIRNTSKIKL